MSDTKNGCNGKNFVYRDPEGTEKYSQCQNCDIIASMHAHQAGTMLHFGCDDVTKAKCQERYALMLCGPPGARGETAEAIEAEESEKE